MKQQHRNGQLKISGFLISMVLLGMLGVVFAIFYSDIAVEYSQNFDNNTRNNLTAFSKLETIQNDTNAMNRELFVNTTGPQSTFDLIGGFLGSGINAIRLAKNSFSAFYEIADHAFSVGPLGESLGGIKQALILVVSIMVVFLVIGAFIGRSV